MSKETKIRHYKFGICVTVNTLNRQKFYNIRIPFSDHNERIKDIRIEADSEKDAYIIAGAIERGGNITIRGNLV